MLIKEKDRKNNYKKLKKLKDKNVFLENVFKTDEEKAFISAFNEKDLKKRYSFIYDYMCNYLDKNVCVFCDFKCDKCVANRLNKSVHKKNGCCYFRKDGFCKYLKNRKCMNPNISCKLFMCSYVERKILKKKSIPKNYLLLNYFFNRKQQELLKRSYKMKKQDLIDLLMKNK